MKKETKVDSRRKFLKKAVYAAPAVIALGSLVKPKDAHAGLTDNFLGGGGSSLASTPS